MPGPDNNRPDYSLKQYYYYWGKLNKSNDNQTHSYHLLAYHCLDVAAVSESLLRKNCTFTEDISQFLQIPQEKLINLLAFFAAIHDLGKFASAFQNLAGTGESLYGFKSIKAYDGANYRHDRLGYYFWKHHKKHILYSLVKRDTDLPECSEELALDSLSVLIEPFLGHHGKPINKNDVSGLKLFIEDHNKLASKEFIEDLLCLFKPDLPLELLTDKEWQNRLKQISWHLAGFAVLSDWLGSNSDFFLYSTDIVALEDYWSVARNRAKKILDTTELWCPLKVQPFVSFEQHYRFNPTPLQQWAESVQVDSSPQLFILEDVTGAGKTEAALVLTHRLMQEGAASGFYFGLPTMATSNAMFSRVARHYAQMLTTADGHKPSIVLAHGARDMNQQFREVVLASDSNEISYANGDESITAQCNQWLADSRKKALLAPVGVGTIDQTLLAVLPRRHQSLRLLGLNRKVLIFDEVHAADEYMFELLESLLALHLHQGGSVVLLTATLAKKQRQKLIDVWARHLQLGKLEIQNTHFPLATKVSVDSDQPLLEQSLQSHTKADREVAVIMLDSFAAVVDKIVSIAAAGQCVVWVRNTVNDALEAWQAISACLGTPEDCLLFHSRFTLLDRKNKENKVLEIFGKNSTKKDRFGKVLIATQVFQESLDVDADVMFSDICPIDDLIQRAGRLQRHTRNDDGAYQQGIEDMRTAPQLFLYAPVWNENPEADWLKKDFAGTQAVYRSPGRLWLGMRELIKLGALRMPSEARQLIEAVYSDEAYEQIPSDLVDAEHKVLGEERGKVAKAQSSVLDWQNHGYSSKSAGAWFEDDTDISTRYSDIETAELVVLKQVIDGSVALWAQGESFALSLSIVQLSVSSYITKMQLLSPDDPSVKDLMQAYPRLKYLRLWLPEQDLNFGYSADIGVYKKSPQVRGTI